MWSDCGLWSCQINKDTLNMLYMYTVYSCTYVHQYNLYMMYVYVGAVSTMYLLSSLSQAVVLLGLPTVVSSLP